MKQFLVILAVLLLARLGNATDTEYAIDTEVLISLPNLEIATITLPTQNIPFVGTQTTGTDTVIPPIPYIQSINIVPKEVILQVGERLVFTAIVQQSDGSTGTANIKYSCDKGIIGDRGNFIATQTGTAIITANVNGIIDTAKVTLLPDKIAKIKFVINEPKVIYGRIYNKDLFVFTALDQYDNEVPIEKIKYEIRRKGITRISQWVGDTILPITEILKAGVIKDNGNMLFFDIGEYELKVSINDYAQAQFVFSTAFDGFDVTPWGDYRIIDIDFDSGTYVVEYAFDGVPAIQSHFTVRNEWLKQFKEGNFMQKIQVLTWIHYNILSEWRRLLKSIEYERLKNSLLKHWRD